MATLSDLDGGPISLIEVLPEDELPWRYLYGSNEFIEWLKNILPTIESTTLGAQLSPHEQVFASLDEYVTGEPFNDDRRFKTLNWTPDHFVWEFKTDDIRIFGWVPRRDCFIATFGDTKDNVETLQLYGRYIAMTSFFRKNLDLDEPKYLTSKDYNDVVSNKPE